MRLSVERNSQAPVISSLRKLITSVKTLGQEGVGIITSHQNEN